MSRTPRILVVEDDPEIRSLLKDYLHRQGLRVDTADGGPSFDRMMAQYGEPDLVVLDIMMPGEDGFSICRRLRATSSVPVIMLDRTWRRHRSHCRSGDRSRRLICRSRSIRASSWHASAPCCGVRSGSGSPAGVGLSSGMLTVDLDARTVLDHAGAAIDLTSAEFELLACFVTRPRRVLSRDQLMDLTRGRKSNAFDRTIDVQLSRLRKKIEVNGEPLIKTVRSAGYILAVSVEEA